MQGLYSKYGEKSGLSGNKLLFLTIIVPGRPENCCSYAGVNAGSCRKAGNGFDVRVSIGGRRANGIVPARMKLPEIHDALQ